MKTIFVTQTDIDNGIRFKPSQCPIALSINKYLKYRYSCAGADSIALTYKEPLFTVSIFIPYFMPTREEIKTPEAVSNFIKIFDMGYEVKPFTFELDI